jgi:hypothetical protein
MKPALKLFAALAALSFCQGAWAGEGKQVNALLVVPSAQAAFDAGLQGFLDKNGARLLHSYPPALFVGFIPQPLDAELGGKYGALVYRDKVEDWSSFARYGESAVFAVNAWNKRFAEDPPEAPLVAGFRVQQSGKKGEAFEFSWNEVMNASSYRLQISTDQAFAPVLLDTALARNSYRIFPPFWAAGVYYWRVAGILTLNGGETRGGAFSAPNSFAVSKPARAAGPKPSAPALPAKKRFKGRPLSWEPSPSAKYYRLQLSGAADFSAPLVDVFTDTCAFKLSGLPVKRGAPYYMRVMASDGASAGDWSGVSEVVVESPGPIVNDMRRRVKK